MIITSIKISSQVIDGQTVFTANLTFNPLQLLPIDQTFYVCQFPGSLSIARNFKVIVEPGKQIYSQADGSTAHI